MSTVRSEATRERKKENERDGEDEDGKEALPYRKESVSSSISLQHVIMDLKILMSNFSRPSFFPDFIHLSRATNCCHACVWRTTTT